MIIKLLRIGSDVTDELIENLSKFQYNSQATHFKALKAHQLNYWRIQPQ